MNIHKATQSYENWMRGCTAVIEAHLRLKHKQMRGSPFLFFRGTFYRWAQLWPDVCASLRDAPKVLAVGDLHVGSFGTWRDTEGRLSVDDCHWAMRCRCATPGGTFRYFHFYLGKSNGRLCGR
jgi:uncharacterized protein (DUF2252 family)